VNIWKTPALQAMFFGKTVFICLFFLNVPFSILEFLTDCNWVGRGGGGGGKNLAFGLVNHLGFFL